MSLHIIQSKAELLKKLMTALDDAKADGLKDPMKILRKILGKQIESKSGKARQKRQS